MTRMNMDETPVRTRSRRAVDIKDDRVDAAMIEFAKESYQFNSEKNKYTRMENRSKKALASMMANITGFGFFTFRLGTKNIDVTYEQGDTSTLDQEKLLKLVGPEKFIKIATVTQKAVKDEFGTNVLNQCLDTGKGDFKVNVKERGKK